MIQYLYINGVLLPTPPSSAVCSMGGESEIIKLFDGEHHVFPPSNEPLYLTVKIPVYKDKRTYSDSGVITSAEVLRLLSATADAPFELLLLGMDNNGKITVDINMTAVKDDLSFVHRDGMTEVTFKMRRYTAAEDIR